MLVQDSDLMFMCMVKYVKHMVLIIVKL